MPTKVDHWQKNAGFTSASVKTVPVGAELKTVMSLNNRKSKTKKKGNMMKNTAENTLKVLLVPPVVTRNMHNGRMTSLVAASQPNVC